MNYTTIVYGGAFDPVTVAHEAIIYHILSNAPENSGFLFLVTDNGEKNCSVDVADRLEMLRMAVSKCVRSIGIEGNVDFEVKVQRERTADYLEANGLLDKDTVIVLGMDEWTDLYNGYRWKDAARLKECVRFEVFDRWLGARRWYTRFGFGAGVDAVKVPMNIPAASSSEVSEELRFNPFAAPATVSPDIMHYISFHGLYGQMCPETYIPEQRKFIEEYSAGEYPKPSVTATMVIHTNTEVLLVRRKNHPYKGYWCLPGGFAEPYESIEDAGLRELEEETGLKPECSAGFSRSDVRQVGVFTPEDPRFSREKGTWGYDVALSVNVGDVGKLMARAGDDAGEVAWVTFDRAKDTGLAFHHGKIFSKFMKTFEPKGPINQLL